MTVTYDRVNSCLDLVQGSLEMAHPGELLQMKTTVVKQVKDLVDAFKYRSLLQPIEEASVRFTYDGDVLLGVLKDFGEVYSYDACPEKCNATGMALESAIVAEKSCITLQAINSKDCLCEEPIHSLECELISEITGSVVFGSIERRDKSFHSLYDICYKPVDKGRHQLHILVEGEHIRGSPFTVAVKLDERIEDPISSIHELICPVDVTVTNDGKVVVTEAKGNCVSVFSLHGNKLATFGEEGVNEGQFVDPRGITTDLDGNLLVTDVGNCRLQKFSTEGVFLEAFGGDLFDFTSPTSIVFNTVNSSYYITDSKSHCICIVSSDFKTVIKFGERGNGRSQLCCPSSVACDSTGKVYVADSGNHRVQVFTAEGQYIRRIGKEGSGEGCLRCPSGICVAEDCVYVSELDNNRVSVFSIEGKFVYSFGGRGLLRQPQGMAVDASGVVCVCDSGNSCFHLF